MQIMTGTMIERIWITVQTNFQVVVVTFEVFWIIVFLLDRVRPGGAGGVPQFVYVNF
jgi:hypothetical protein